MAEVTGMNEVVLVAGVRTAQGKFAGGLKDFQAPDLGGFVIKEVIKRAKIKPTRRNYRPIRQSHG